MNFSRSDLLKWNVAATLWTWPSRNWFSSRMNDMTAIWSGKFLSLILQKHGEEEGWAMEWAGFEATWILRVRLPTVKRTKGHGSIVSLPSLHWYFFYFEKTLPPQLLQPSTPNTNLHIINFSLYVIWRESKVKKLKLLLSFSL